MRVCRLTASCWSLLFWWHHQTTLVVAATDFPLLLSSMASAHNRSDKHRRQTALAKVAGGVVEVDEHLITAPSSQPLIFGGCHRRIVKRQDGNWIDCVNWQEEVIHANNTKIIAVVLFSVYSLPMKETVPRSKIQVQRCRNCVEAEKRYQNVISVCVWGGFDWCSSETREIKHREKYVGAEELLTPTSTVWEMTKPS